jgi:hypothetical protein
LKIGKPKSHRHEKETATHPAAHPRRSATLRGVKCWEC